MGTSTKNSCKTAAVMNLLRRPEERGTNGIVPNLGTSGREQIEYIDIDLIDDDPNNFYELSGLEELAANIELLGLQQPIRVRAGAERGRYIIVSGHRRRAAVRQLVEDGHGELRDLPCIVEQGQDSAALQELRLIYANSDTRKMTPSDISRQAERVEALLYQLKEEGYEFPGRMRDHVAEACKVSKSKLARLKVIRENLAEPWRPAYEAGKLAEATAYTLAQMPIERQRVICDGLAKRGTMPGSAQEYQVRDYGENLAQVEAVECTSYGHGPCLNREAMQGRIMQADHWSYNYCRQCCDQCNRLSSCKDACSMLADKVKQLKADAKAQRDQDKQAQEKKARSKVEQIKELWKRFGEARAAAGKSPKECHAAGGMYYANGGKEDVYEKREQLEGKFSEDTTLPFGLHCFLGEVQRYVKIADLLGVSLDYLLCRTDDPTGLAPHPEGQMVFNGWMPGGTMPRTPCDAVADFDFAGTGSISRMVCQFDGKRFRHKKIDGSKGIIDIEPVRWMALPSVD